MLLLLQRSRGEIERTTRAGSIQSDYLIPAAPSKGGKGKEREEEEAAGSSRQWRMGRFVGEVHAALAASSHLGLAAGRQPRVESIYVCVHSSRQPYLPPIEHGIFVVGWAFESFLRIYFFCFFVCLLWEAGCGFGESVAQ